jgi:hypothetical protein
MTIRVLFADDQLPSPIDAENEQTRREIRLDDRPGIKDIDAACASSGPLNTAGCCHP